MKYFIYICLIIIVVIIVKKYLDEKRFKCDMYKRGYLEIEIMNDEGEVIRGFCSKAVVRRYYSSQKINTNHINLIVYRFFKGCEEEKKIKSDNIIYLDIE